MQHHLFWVVFVAYFSFFNKCETKQQQQENDIPYVLSQLFENKNKPPILLYLEPKQNVRINAEPQDETSEIQHDIEREEDDDSNENMLRTTQSNERAYILYHLLRTTIDEEEIDDPARLQNLQHTKEFLRTAFIGRCRKLKKCLRQCPKPEIKYTCKVQCKQVFDDLDECDEPKPKCGEPKCGNTMPPSWLL